MAPRLRISEVHLLAAHVAVAGRRAVSVEQARGGYVRRDIKKNGHVPPAA